MIRRFFHRHCVLLAALVGLVVFIFFMLFEGPVRMPVVLIWIPELVGWEIFSALIALLFGLIAYGFISPPDAETAELSKARLYHVYGNPLQKRMAIKHGWSWPAFLFTWIWALTRRMWGLGIGIVFFLVVAGITAGFVSQGSPEEVMPEFMLNLMALILMLVFGINGNRWRRSALESRGYKLRATVMAPNGEAAIAASLREDLEKPATLT